MEWRRPPEVARPCVDFHQFLLRLEKLDTSTLHLKAESPPLSYWWHFAISPMHAYTCFISEALYPGASRQMKKYQEESSDFSEVVRALPSLKAHPFSHIWSTYHKMLLGKDPMRDDDCKCPSMI